MKQFLFLLLLTVGLASCTKDNLINDDLPEGAIGFSNAMLTRGTPVENADGILSMGVLCSLTEGIFANFSSDPINYMNNVMVSRKDATAPFSYSPFRYWPLEENKYLSFHAYSPHSSTLPGGTLSFVTTGGVPKMIYTVPTDVTAQPDLMLAISQTNKTKAVGRIAFNMKHVLTSVGFKIAGQGERVTSVKISGVSTVGTLSMTGVNIVWTDLNTPQTTVFTAGTKTDAEAEDVLTNITNGNGYLMMIPQTLGEDAKLTVTLDNGKTKNISLAGRVWKAGETMMYSVTLTPEGTIVIDPADFYLPATAVDAKTDNIEVIYTPDPGSNPSQTDNSWTLSSGANWLTLSLTQGTTGTATVSGNGSQKVYVFASANNGNADRTTALSINRRPENVVCNVTQLKPIVFADILNGGVAVKNGYVGAFWRADQSGERIIRIPVPNDASSEYIGKWSAYVAWISSNWKVNDIVLSNNQSIDAGINFNNEATPGNAELYPVDGDHTAVGGNANPGDIIYFRIGLKSKYIPTDANPARYAVVVFSYGNHSQQSMLFLRQGHDPDYLMRSVDKYGNEQTWASSPTWRPEAHKFSPYNLTASTLGENDYATPDVNGAVFVDYPTQAGALFQWAGASGFERRAYHPNKAMVNDNWGISSVNGYWNTMKDTHEVSPVNYLLSYGTRGNFRRPNDGAPNDKGPQTVKGSEIRQSLMMNPLDNETSVENTNSVFGYYADGYFDRRFILDNKVSAQIKIWHVAVVCSLIQ